MLAACNSACETAWYRREVWQCAGYCGSANIVACVAWRLPGTRYTGNQYSTCVEYVYKHEPDNEVPGTTIIPATSATSMFSSDV